MPLKNSGQDIDKNVQEAIDKAPEGMTFYPTTRTYQGEWPKWAEVEISRGKGKPKLKKGKACANQEEYDAFMAQGSKAEEKEETLESLEA